MTGFNQKVISERKLTVLVLLILLISTGFFFSLYSWYTDLIFQNMLTMASFLLSGFVGIMAFIKFFTRKKNKYLFIGSGFLVASFLEGFSTFVSFELGSTVWSAARILLGAFVLLSLKDWKEGEGIQKGLKPRVYISAAFSAVLIIGAVYLLPTYSPYWKFIIFSRPLELVAMALFGFAVLGYWQKGYWTFKFFEFWFVLSLITAFFGQAYLAMSANYFDSMFNVGNIFRLLSYLFTLVGLLMSTFAAFREIEAEKKIQAGYTSGEYLVKRTK
ncbi:MAG: Sensory box histidine kinase [Candidatus Woesebacteria bacterium GW2011_GWB1_45_5]|uniref:Sensory box histidine kinase n=1 Tax=Candidatus Woesebacteria bacterium GW2011_GWB1_45_5 TaxID=1618581 RepID=A0A0G1MQV1_9BACT|nr:MAG: Sensory box histidine kinase [Candidatus Woesebacteria bacterium GW2011_GWB1_45_5]